MLGWSRAARIWRSCLKRRTKSGLATSPADDLQRHSLAERVVVAYGQIDRAHAAAAQLANQFVGPHLPARLLRLGTRHLGHQRGRRLNRLREKTARAFMGLQHAGQFVVVLRVTLRHPGQHARAVGRRQGDGVLKQVAQRRGRVGGSCRGSSCLGSSCFSARNGQTPSRGGCGRHSDSGSLRLPHLCSRRKSASRRPGRRGRPQSPTGVSNSSSSDSSTSPAVTEWKFSSSTFFAPEPRFSACFSRA